MRRKSRKGSTHTGLFGSCVALLRGYRKKAIERAHQSKAGNRYLCPKVLSSRYSAIHQCLNATNTIISALKDCAKTGQLPPLPKDSVAEEWFLTYSFYLSLLKNFLLPCLKSWLHRLSFAWGSSPRKVNRINDLYHLNTSYSTTKALFFVSRYYGI